MAELAVGASQRNQALLVFEYVCFGIGMAFLGTTTILPTFIRQLGGGPLFVGVFTALQTGGWLLPQLWASRSLAHRPLVKGYVVGLAALSRACLLLLVPLLWLTAVRVPKLGLMAILLAFAGFWVGDALASVGWFDLVAKAIPLERRGRVMGIGQSASALVAIGAGVLVQMILARQRPFPENYLLLILLGGICFAIGLVAIALVRESHGIVQGETQLSWREYFPRLASILRTDRRFAWLTVTRWLAGLADMAAPFYVLFATDRLHLPEQMVGLFISAGVVGSLLSGMLLGSLGDRKGSARVITVILALRCLCPILALLAPWLAGLYPWLAPGVFVAIFATAGMASGANMVGFMNYLLEIAPAGERSLYVGLGNTLGGLLLISPVLGGWLVQVASYQLLFGVALVLAAAGFLVALRGSGYLTGSVS